LIIKGYFYAILCKNQCKKIKQFLK